jgi:hypothetical protein
MFPFSGLPSWGIAWYINDMLIPEIYVERGQTYTFIVEGGKDQTNPARYHPFYITDSSEGGFGQKSEREQKKQRVFAGVRYDADGEPYPTAGVCHQLSFEPSYAVVATILLIIHILITFKDCVQCSVDILGVYMEACVELVG